MPFFAFPRTLLSAAGGAPLWITQLVVHADFRSRHIGSDLITHAKIAGADVAVAGLASTHPHAIRALRRACAAEYDSAFLSTHCRGVLEACQIPYLQPNMLVGSAFQEEHAHDDDDQYVVALANTNFHVDHAEPNRLSPP
jgi:hypothetical protein